MTTDRQDLVIELITQMHNESKVGIIVKGISDIDPLTVIAKLSETVDYKLFSAIVGYSVEAKDTANYCIEDSIEKAVFWRSDPEYAGRIIVFIKNDIDKLHSLAEFDILTTRDLSQLLIRHQMQGDKNIPTFSFWNALLSSADYYSFDALSSFVDAVNSAEKPETAIAQNMWRINLLRDDDIMASKTRPEERLQQNRDLILKLGQLNEGDRKKLSRTLAHTQPKNKARLQNAYQALQKWYKYGKQDMLTELDFKTMQELLSATKSIDTRKKDKISNATPVTDEKTDNTPIKQKELNELVADSLVIGDDDDNEALTSLLDAFKQLYNPEDNDDGQEQANQSSIPVVGGRFEERTIRPEAGSSDLRKLVGKTCSFSAWGGLLETSSSVLRDAISADIDAFHPFDPHSEDSIVSFIGGIDGGQALFDFLIQFDAQFTERKIEAIEAFAPIIDALKKYRNDLLDYLDMIMYQPILLFGADHKVRELMIKYIDTWASLYNAFNKNEPFMREISASGTGFASRALLLLDILYVKTPTEWKAILLPMHPVYLWRYYEVFKGLPEQREKLSDDDKKTLSTVLAQLPQILSFVIANTVVTDSEDRVLPCSGCIEMLPTFENKTNRYLGDDGTSAIANVLSRWIAFAPYTKNEVRICSVDAPDLIGVIRQIKDFMDNTECDRVVYDVYLTRDQNGNTEMSRLDYSGTDYEIGEYIRSGKISISIRNVKNVSSIDSCLSKKPVHIAFFFDQSAYAIEYGASSHNLYITPLVITYQYEFDAIEHRGKIYPSSEAESGLIGDYHKLMRLADIVTGNRSPRTTYSGNADMTSVVSTIEKNHVQWLVVADRDTSNYQPPKSIPIGEMQYDKRMVNVWASSQSRIIDQYLTLLRKYNLYPQRDTLINILKDFGHIASSGLISIPRSGSNTQAIENAQKGLIGTLFASSWYTHEYQDSLVASLDDNRAKTWLQDSKHGNERADLIGLHYDSDSDTLFIQPIEVKTRDESPDAEVIRDASDEHHKNSIRGHAADQIASIVRMLKDIFEFNVGYDIFSSARKEVLKYQIISECFRNVHDSDWQKHWYEIFRRAFTKDGQPTIKIVISGILVHIKLNEVSGGFKVNCKHSSYEECEIELCTLTAKEIQQQVLGGDTELKERLSPDFDTSESEDTKSSKAEDAIIDRDLDSYAIINEKRSSEDMHDEHSDFEIKKDNTVNSKVSPDSISAPNEYEVTREEIEQLVRDFTRACGDYRVTLRECDSSNVVIGPSVIRLRFKLGRGQSKQGLSSHLEDIGREMKRSGIIIQDVRNSDELFLDIPRLHRERVLFRDVIKSLPIVDSPEKLYFALGRTPNGTDLIEDLGQLPHLLVGGSTGSGKTVFLFTLLSALLKTHPTAKELQLVLSSSGLEDFIHFEGIPHLVGGRVISDAEEATELIKTVVFEEFERREKILADARVANIAQYNAKFKDKLAPMVVVIDEFADLADQLETKRDKEAFFTPVKRIAQIGRKRGIHLILCTQRPAANLVPSNIKAQLNGRVALRVNDFNSSKMIIEESGAQYLQKHGDMIYRNGDVMERAQGYLIEINELDEIIDDIKQIKINN